MNLRGRLDTLARLVLWQIPHIAHATSLRVTARYERCADPLRMEVRVGCYRCNIGARWAVDAPLQNR